MPLTRTLYHPRFEPRTSWLRSMLLFYDTVHTIVPAGAKYRSSPRVANLLARIPDGLVALEPTRADLEYDWARYYGLINVLQQLPTRATPDPRTFRPAHLQWEDNAPRFDLRAGVTVHTDKMGEMLVHDLLRLGLAVRTDEEKWIKVERRVADLVLSMLAQRMVANRADVMGTATDSVSSFAVSARSELSVVENRDWSAESTLASRILSAEVPARIDTLPLERYLEIREAYRGKRDVFRLAMQELSRLHLDASVGNPAVFQHRLDEVVGEFGAAMQDIRRKGLRNRVEQWAPVVIGGVVTITGLLAHQPVVAYGAAGVKLTLEVLKTATPKVAGTYTVQAQSMLVKLGRDLRRQERGWLARALS